MGRAILFGFSLFYIEVEASFVAAHGRQALVLASAVQQGQWFKQDTCCRTAYCWRGVVSLCYLEAGGLKTTFLELYLGTQSLGANHLLSRVRVHYGVHIEHGLVLMLLAEDLLTPLLAMGAS
jgi:hypothetical protein